MSSLDSKLGQALGEESFPPPFLAPYSQEHATSRGINYASGAAGIWMKQDPYL